MNYTDEAYLKLLANAISINEYQIDFSLVSMDRLKKLCNMHKTIGLVCVGMKKVINLPRSHEKTFETGLKLEVIEYVNKNNLFDKLSLQLSDNEIKHVLVKGRTVAQYYPQEELRRLGDIDLLISTQDRARVKSIIEQMGGKHFPERSDGNVDYFILENLIIEVNTKIVAGKRFSESSLYDYFTKLAYDNSVLVNNLLYELDQKMSFVYNVYHTAKHFYESGCGVRMVADLWLMKNAIKEECYKDALDILDDMGLKGFALKIFDIGEKWFGNSDKEINNLELIQKYIISGGIYGNGNVSTDVGQMRKNEGGNYFIKVIKWCFPSYKYMRENNSWFENKPAILLPIAYVVRGYTNIKKRGGISNSVSRVVKGKKQNSHLEMILNVMELGDE